MKRIVEWLIKRYLRDYHLARNPRKGRKSKVKAVCVESLNDKGGEANG